MRRGTEAAVYTRRPQPAQRQEGEELLLLLTVDLGNSRQEQLAVHAGEDSMSLARTFCLKHRLPLHLCEVLADTIETNLKQRRGVLTERQNTERSVTDRSSGDKTPNRTLKQGYAARFEERKTRPELTRMNTIPKPSKAVRSLVQRALAAKENQASPLTVQGSFSRSKQGHRRSSSMAEHSAERVQASHKPTHTRERSEQVGFSSADQSSSQPSQTPEPACESVVTHIKRHRYEEIFRAIKSPEDSVLRAGHVRTNLINSGLLKVLSPLLDELRDMGETLTLEEFQASMENLVPVLTKPERNVLFYPFELDPEPRPKSSLALSDPVEVTECTFKPQRSNSHLRSASTLM